MGLRNLLTAAGAFALTTVPAVAQAAATRAAAPVEGQSDLFGGSTLITILVIIALGVGIFLLVDDDDGPDSP